MKEDYDRFYVTITVMRDLSIYRDRIVLEYATSDLTAQGIDSIKYQECLRLPPMKRSQAKCGDYEQTRGEMVIEADRDRSTFTIGIIDDLCLEQFMEYIQITLAVPGSASLLGETVSAKLRIDDNDEVYGTKYC